MRLEILLAVSLTATAAWASKAHARFQQPAPTAPAAVQLRLGAPIAAIGETDGAPEYLFSRLGGVQLRDDRIVVADNGSAQLRFYDGRGRFLKSIGRRGGGPGEFGWLELVPNWSSDS